MPDCIYCGEPATDKDHVPPRGLIRPSNRINLWTVNSCATCNRGASKDEEYFRLMVIGALCHTVEADELFDGAITRSMNRLPRKEAQFFDSFKASNDLPYIEWDAPALIRVALKIACGLAYALSLEQPKNGTKIGLDERNGRGDHAQWAPDFSFSVHNDKWELWFFDSVCISVGRA